MKLAISGLGKMGGQIAVKLIQHGHVVIGHDIDRTMIDSLVPRGINPAYSAEEVVDAFGDEPVVLWLMIPAQFVTSSLAMWCRCLPSGSILIDGGNTDFRDDKIHADTLAAHGITLIDVGTSGGIWGLENGFSMMVGGTDEAFQKITPVLDTLAAPRGGYKFFGETGAGHYIKMVHNAIEYGMMESLAEGYQILRDGPYKNLNLADAGDVWQQSSVVTSWLNDLTRQIMHNDPTLDGIDGIVAESGEARWTLEVAREHAIPMPVIQAALDVRIGSQNGQVDYRTKLLAAMRNKFGGHDINAR